MLIDYSKLPLTVNVNTCDCITLKPVQGDPNFCQTVGQRWVPPIPSPQKGVSGFRRWMVEWKDRSVLSNFCLERDLMDL